MASLWRRSWRGEVVGTGGRRSVFLSSFEFRWFRLRSLRCSDLARKNGVQNDATLCGVNSAMEGVGETRIAALRSPRSALSDGEVESWFRRLDGMTGCHMARGSNGTGGLSSKAELTNCGC